MQNRFILKVTKFHLPPPKHLGTVVKNILGAVMPPMGAPIAPLIHLFTPFFGRIHVVMLVEVPFSRACTSCCFLLDLIVPTASHFLVQLRGGAASSPAGPGQSSGGVQGALPLELQKSGISRYKIQPKTHFRGSISFYKMNLKGKIIHLMFQTRPMTHVCTNIAELKSKILKLTLHLYINIHQQFLNLYGCRSP